MGKKDGHVTYLGFLKHSASNDFQVYTQGVLEKQEYFPQASFESSVALHAL